MNTEIIISTFGNRVQSIDNMGLKALEGVHYTIIHQYQNDNDLWKSKLWKRADINYYSFKEKGLARSRNRGLKLAKADIILFLDDDVTILYENLPHVVNLFQNHPDWDVVSLQTITPDGSLRKEYGNMPYRHSKNTITNISSIELAFRLDSLRKNGLYFDERFGLGSKFPASEEYIFLMDCLSRNLKLMYYPMPVCSHPKESTGNRINSIEMIEARGAVCRRVFGIKGILAILYIAIKNYRKYKHETSLIQYLTKAFHGWKLLKTTH